MPRIPLHILNSTVYLYPSREDAEAGRPVGGTGFIVAYPFPENPSRGYPYVITNWHVAVQQGASVVRVNSVTGGVDIFELDPSQWHFIPGQHDLAVTPLPLFDNRHAVSALDVNLLIAHEELGTRDIGPGDDVFMIGRFVDHDGAGTNVPSVRFGHISVMPQPITQPTGATRLNSFILDVNSRTGYSGSPVFIFRTPASDITTGSVHIGSPYIKLLGLHWGQFPELWEIEGGMKPLPQGVSITDDALYVKGLSGMTLALPAWAIREFLDMPHFVSQRAQAEAQRRAQGLMPIAETAAQLSGGAEPTPASDENF
jgi:hypothetical protein